MKPIIQCKNCNEQKKHEARGLCITCYNRIKYDLPTRPKIQCIECQQLKPHKAKQRCQQCYSNYLNRKRYENGKENKKIIECQSCKQFKPHKAHGCCENCYAAIRQRKTYHENIEIRRKKLIKTRDYKIFKNEKKNCEECTSTENLHIHHLTYEENNSLKKILCRSCHMKHHRKHTFEW